MMLKIGRRATVYVATLAEASEVYQKLRAESGEGYSTFPDGRVGVYRISYNGNVWLGDTLHLHATLPPDTRLQQLLDMAQQHGEDSEPDHEVGDLQEMLTACWATMSPADRRKVFALFQAET